MQKPRKVLIVDDQEINRDILGSILEDEYELICADCGKNALEQIAGNADDLSFVMLDLMMPDMNGFEVIRAKTQKRSR